MHSVHLMTPEFPIAHHGFPGPRRFSTYRAGGAFQDGQRLTRMPRSPVCYTRVRRLQLPLPRQAAHHQGSPLRRPKNAAALGGDSASHLPESVWCLCSLRLPVFPWRPKDADLRDEEFAAFALSSLRAKIKIGSSTKARAAIIARLQQRK
jgi:hypothetical protein